jgi:hypothetical protein
MRLKTLLSALLVALLLSTSSGALACDLACSLPRLHSCCGGTALPVQQTESMPAGMGMGQGSSGEAAEAKIASQPGTIFLVDAPRSSELCSPSTVSVLRPSDFKPLHAPATSLTGSLLHQLRPIHLRVEIAPTCVAETRPIPINLRI